MTSEQYFSDYPDENDEETERIRKEGYIAGVKAMYENIDIVAELCAAFPVEDRLNMFLAMIKEI